MLIMNIETKFRLLRLQLPWKRICANFAPVDTNGSSYSGNDRNDLYSFQQTCFFRAILIRANKLSM